MNKELEKAIQEKASPAKAKILSGFFKTGKGEYGEGDIFLGIVVPEQRKIAKEFSDITLEEIQELLSSKIHEKRMIGLFILIKKYEIATKQKDEETKKDIFNIYLKNAAKNNINNWDLVDLSAPNIPGNYLLDKRRDILYWLVKSQNLWERRIAILSTFAFIRKGEFSDTIKISEILLSDSHDLMHKSVGWMLREVGKRDVLILEKFLKKHYKNMPRTMLRYAIEKFDKSKRDKYLKGEI
jgi:3-methyladenine DNA glycosylase AlkD